MASRLYNVPIGSDLVAAPGNGWQIAGLRIDNPSGSWLHVEGADVFVPPYRSGWQYDLTPTQTFVTVRWTDSPSGSVSTQEGTAATIELFDHPIGPSEGVPTGAGARVTIVPAFLTVYDEWESDEPKNAPVADMLLDEDVPLVLREISTAYNFINGNLADGYYAPQASVQTFWQVAPDTSNPPINPIWQWRQTISLESPYVSTPLPDGAVRIPVGYALFVDVWTEPGGGKIDCILQAAYYEEAVLS